MTQRLLLAVLALAAAGLACTAVPVTPAARYGDDPSAGHTFTHDGVSFYYEVYGTGEPLLMVHGNGGSIANFAAQIDHFRERWQVIVMDSRDHGKSGDSPVPLTFEMMADDLAALLDHLHAGPANVLGWSDGANQALLLGIRHPAQVNKIVAMSANLTPDADALCPELLELMHSMDDAPPADPAMPPQSERERRQLDLALHQPHIALTALETITAPTLVLAGDHDVIRDEHTVEIFHHVPNSQLAIFPGATHLLPYDDPAAFNAMVERFLVTPFVKSDRIGDMLRSLERLAAEEEQPEG